MRLRSAMPAAPQPRGINGVERHRFPAEAPMGRRPGDRDAIAHRAATVRIGSMTCRSVWCLPTFNTARAVAQTLAMRASATPKADAVGTAILAGLLAGIVMGGVVHAGSTVLSTIGAIVGTSAAIAGWIVHLLLSIGFALGFVLLLATTPADAAFREPVDTALLGV